MDCAAFSAVTITVPSALMRSRLTVSGPDTRGSSPKLKTIKCRLSTALERWDDTPRSDRSPDCKFPLPQRATGGGAARCARTACACQPAARVSRALVIQVTDRLEDREGACNPHPRAFRFHSRLSKWPRLHLNRTEKCGIFKRTNISLLRDACLSSAQCDPESATLQNSALSVAQSVHLRHELWLLTKRSIVHQL